MSWSNAQRSGARLSRETWKLAISIIRYNIIILCHRAMLRGEEHDSAEKHGIVDIGFLFNII